ncbi:MAG: hypothetical protein AAGK33_02645 [Pseudomonadota bacterium]
MSAFANLHRLAWWAAFGAVFSTLPTMALGQEQPTAATRVDSLEQQEPGHKTEDANAAALVAQADAILARYLAAQAKAGRDAAWGELNALVTQAEDERFAGQVGRFGPLLARAAIYRHHSGRVKTGKNWKAGKDVLETILAGLTTKREQQDPVYTRTLLMLGHFYNDVGERNLAALNYQTAAGDAPVTDLKRWHRAEASMRAALALPNTNAGRKNKALGAALDLLQPAKEQHPRLYGELLYAHLDIALRARATQLAYRRSAKLMAYLGTKPVLSAGTRALYLQRIASALRGVRRYEEALTRLKQAQRVLTEADYPPLHQDYLNVRHLIALALYRMGNNDEALVVLDDLIALLTIERDTGSGGDFGGLSKTKLGYLAGLIVNRAELAAALNDTDEAYRYALEARDVYRTIHGRNHAKVRAVEKKLAQWRPQLGDQLAMNAAPDGGASMTADGIVPPSQPAEQTDRPMLDPLGGTALDLFLKGEYAAADQMLAEMHAETEENGPTGPMAEQVALVLNEAMLQALAQDVVGSRNSLKTVWPLLKEWVKQGPDARRQALQARAAAVLISGAEMTMGYTDKSQQNTKTVDLLRKYAVPEPRLNAPALAFDAYYSGSIGDRKAARNTMLAWLEAVAPRSDGKVDIFAVFSAGFMEPLKQILPPDDRLRQTITNTTNRLRAAYPGLRYLETSRRFNDYVADPQFFLRADALDLLAGLRRDFAAMVGPNSTVLIDITSNFARVYDAQGNHAKALELNREAIAMANRQYEPSTVTMARLYTLGSRYAASAGAQDQSLVAARRAAALQDEIDWDHSGWLDAHIAVADRLEATGAHEEALSVIDTLLTNRTRLSHLEAVHRMLLHSRRGSVLLRMENYPDALAAINRSLLEAGYVAGDDSSTISLLGFRSTIQYRMGDLRASYADIREANGLMWALLEDKSRNAASQRRALHSRRGALNEVVTAWSLAQKLQEGAAQ